MRYFTVEGAPFRAGDIVKILKPTDDTGYPDLQDKIGTVMYLNYDCGCGQTWPHDPMIGVEINGEVFEFWQEELKGV